MQNEPNFLIQKRIFSLRKFKAYGLGTAVLGTVVFGCLQSVTVRAEETSLEGASLELIEVEQEQFLEVTQYSNEKTPEEGTVAEEERVIQLNESEIVENVPLERTVLNHEETQPVSSHDERLATNLFTVTSVKEEYIPSSDFVTEHNRLSISLTVDDSVKSGDYIDIQSGYSYRTAEGTEYSSLVRADRSTVPVLFGNQVVGHLTESYATGSYSDRLTFNETINTLKNVSLDLVLNYKPNAVYVDRTQPIADTMNGSLTLNDYEKELTNFKPNIKKVPVGVTVTPENSAKTAAGTAVEPLTVTTLPDSSRYASYKLGDEMLAITILPQTSLYEAKQVIVELELPAGSILELEDPPALATVNVVDYSGFVLKNPLLSNFQLFTAYEQTRGTDYPFISKQELIDNRSLLTIEATSTNNLKFSMWGISLLSSVRIPASAKEGVHISESTVTGQTDNWSYPLVDQSLKEHPITIRLYADGILKETQVIDGVEYSLVRNNSQTIPADAVRLLGKNETSEDIQTTEPISFNTERRANPAKPVGWEEEIQAGVVGERTVVHRIVKRNGEIVSNTLISDRVTKEVVPRIIEYGTAIEEVEEVVETEELPFNIGIRFNDQLPEGQEREIQAGVVGQKVITKRITRLNNLVVKEEIISDRVVKEPQDSILEVGTLREWNEETLYSVSVPFETVHRPNPLLLQGQEREVQAGVNGVLTFTEVIVYRNGQVFKTYRKDEQLLQATTRIIEYGTLVESKEEVQNVELINFKTIRRSNPLLLEGTEQTIQVGIVGKKTLTYLQTKHNGQVVNEKLVSEELILPAQDEVIEYGTLKEIFRQVEKTVEVPFPTHRWENPTLLKGEERVIRRGTMGEKVLTYHQTLHNDVVVKEQLLSEVESKPAVPQIIEYGSLIVSNEEIRRTEVLPFVTHRRENPALLKDEERVIQEGIEGEKVLTYLQTLYNGIVVKEQLLSEVESKPAVNCIVEYGTLMATRTNRTIRQSLSFMEIRKANSQLPQGQESLLVEGQIGERLQTYSQLYHNGILVSEELTSDTISRSPVDRIVEYGTLVSTIPSTISKTIESDSYISETLPNTGEEKNVLPVSGFVLLGLSSLLASKRRED